jgi:hypothetical protein
MPIASIKTYYDQIDGLLDTASTQHDDAQLATLGAAVQERRGTAADTAVQDVAGQLVNVLAQADANLEPNQVQELEKHVHKRLPNA